MKAVILAAGIGSRLRPITNEKPKTMVEVNGRPMINCIIDALHDNGIKNIVVCTGFMATKLVNHLELEYTDINFKFIENKDYDTTNNMYSLYLAKEELDDDILLMNADLVFDKSIIRELVKTKTTSVAVDKGNYIEEAMKLKVENNIIKGISKKISKEEAYGSSIDIYKINKSDIKFIKKEMKRIIEQEKDLNQWTEVMLNNLFESGEIEAKPLDIGNKKWFEIDNFEDLAQAEELFNDKLNSIKDKKIFFIDRDGTITLEDEIIPGAKDFIDHLDKKGILYYIITNNSSRTPEKHLEKLNNIGFNFSIDNILVSTDSALNYFKNKGIKKLFYIANNEVSNYILSKGFEFDENKPDALLLTYDNEINYSKMRKFVKLLRKGIPYYATHKDYVCPTPEGDIPDIGSFIELFNGVTGFKPNKIFGKPDYNFISETLKTHNLKDKDAVIIGDRLYTDISLAINNEITSILTLTGETTRQDYEKSEIKADIIVKNIKDLIKYL